MLSGGVHATMASSAPLVTAERLIIFGRPTLQSRAGPQFILHVYSSMPSPLPRWTNRVHTCFFPDHTSLRRLYKGSTSTYPRTLVPTRAPNEADSGSLALRPARLLALHQQGLLRPSFRRTDRPEPASAITTWANSIPRTGLPPARHAAVWAARRVGESANRFAPRRTGHEDFPHPALM
jgi:hypothetical protein